MAIREVVDADLADYFGSIPHSDLLKAGDTRIIDRRVLHLIKMWLHGPGPRNATDEEGEDTHDRGSGQQARHSARLTHLTTARQPLHAPVRAGVEEARA